MQTITLPITALRSLMFGEFGDKSLSSLGRPESAILGDPPPKITHYEIGALIKHVDISEDFFHVELIETPTKQAEIWLIYDWCESNARRKRFREREAKRNEEYAVQTSLTAELADELTATKLPETLVKQLAREIAANYKKHDLTALLRSLNVEEVIIKYK